MRQSAFPRTARVLKTVEYDYVKSEGSRAYGQWLMISYVSARVGRKTEYGARLGIAITKKVATRAVDRNRFKRLIRDSFRTIRKEIKQAVDIVVVARRDITRAPASQIRSEFLSLLSQERIISIRQ